VQPLALTKLQGEQWGRLHARLWGLRFVALRFFSVWGPGQRPDLAFECFRRRICVGLPVVIHGDGTQRRDLVHVADVVREIENALHWRGGESVTLNVGTGQNHSVLDILAAAERSVRESHAILHFPGSDFTHFTPRLEHKPPHPADVPETLASLAAVGKELGWEPRISFPDGPIPDLKKV
jgi:UDP-glucuronate 4-epimerase